MAEFLLWAEQLVKSYGGRRVVDQLDLAVGAGSVLGLLGPNGAGKTTTLRMLYGFIEPEAGTISFAGRDFRAHRSEAKRQLGVCTQEDTLDYDLTVRRNLEVYASYFRPRVDQLRQRVDELLAMFELQSYADASPHTLSGGYKRRLLIARSVIHRPQLLFLDEPTTGLDPKARVDVWELVDAMRRTGMAIILTTHYMDEAEQLSDDIVVLSRGVDVAHGKTSAVLGDLVGEHVLVVPADTASRDEIEQWLRRELGHAPAKVLGELRAPLSKEQLGQFSATFSQARFSVREPNLDDLFLKLSVEPNEKPSCA
jgi:lipooligosaccharide transport system ATP-binding protein